ncbi:hypothetical protein [Dokdonia sp. Hel_I_53]|uniref:hypothetical protein n=1 Tax=Dokdonia sp. Hel_I_53 TaxID=1566287 RepID=UPI001199E2D9|nr:hypothetical protein [Dokdonia sp. Hel_I_53]TVZ53062.1 hypothetical protein OD90_2254 [Dokdonia sp. Hel_I_53]
MEPFFRIAYIIILILFIATIWYLIARYILFPIFFKPKIKSSEIFKFLEEKKCSFIEYKTLNSTEKQRNQFNRTKGFSVDELFTLRTQYKIVCFCIAEKKYKIYWIEVQTRLTLFKKRTMQFIEEKNVEILNQLQKEYNQEIIIVADKCPACKSGILTNETECKNCGLNFVAK